MMNPLSRRDFIALAAVLFADVLGLRGYGGGIPTSKGAGHRLAQIYAHDLQAARAIGGAYLRAVPEESDANVLARRIVRSGPVRLRRLDALSKKELTDALQSIIRQDFVSNNTVRLDGWVLSRTEARLCALCVVLQSVR